MKEFTKLGVDEQLAKQLPFTEPTDIQQQAIPLALQGKDIFAASRTGSGKTLAFSLGIIQNTEPGKGIQALVLAPTRELAQQVQQAMSQFSGKKLKIAIIYGGVGIEPQISALRVADIVVGTPGRTLDHLERGTFKTDKVKTLVLDEADKMFEMGFVEDIERIIQALPQKRQTLLFSATLHRDVMHIAHRHMNNPVEIKGEAEVDPTRLTQCFYDVPNNHKLSLLVHFLKEEGKGLVMVFTNSRRAADFVASTLQKNGMDAMAIHGGLTQARRNQIMGRFSDNKVNILVCTDVAARGIDVQGVSHVYNYDIPMDSKDYAHRIGRTARAGNEGKAINLLSMRDYDYFDRVMRDHREYNIERKDLPEFEKIKTAPPRDSDFRSGGGSRGGRPSGRGGGRPPFQRGREGSSRGGEGSSYRSGSSSRSGEGSSYGGGSRSGSSRPSGGGSYRGGSSSRSEGGSSYGGGSRSGSSRPSSGGYRGGGSRR